MNGSERGHKLLMFHVKPSLLLLPSGSRHAILVASMICSEPAVNRSKYPRRAPLNERIELVVSADLKAKAYAIAAAKGKPASEFIRDAIRLSVEAAA
jgi:hypothetical protein